MAVNGYGNQELVGELMQGWELAKQLKAQNGPEVSGETKGMLLEGILSSFEKSLLILKWEQSQSQSQHVVPSTTNMPGSPISVIGSPKSNDFNPAHQDSSRKRKMMSSVTKQEKVSSENGQDGPPDDGYSWRKYGQKDILGAQHPRSYYRCTYRNIQDCCAIKLVQRNDDDPSVFDITYKGTHTCTLGPRSKSAPSQPQKQEQKKQPNFHTIEYQQQPNVMMNFQTGLNIDIQSLENQEIEFPFFTRESGYENNSFIPLMLNDKSFYSSCEPSFVLSPATSDSNYFSTSPCKMSTFGGVHHGQHAESELTEIISATTSRTNSPIIGTDFPLDQLEFNPGFPFDNRAFFPSFSQSKE